jgi:transcriptional regulator GlxA family with amidase domain
VRSSSGVEMMARDFRSANAITTLVIAGGAGVTDAARCEARAPSCSGWRGAVCVSPASARALCAGRGGPARWRRATTHWGRTRDFVARYPKVKFEPDQIFTQTAMCGRRRASPRASTSRSRWSTEDHG